MSKYFLTGHKTGMWKKEKVNNISDKLVLEYSVDNGDITIETPIEVIKSAWEKYRSIVLHFNDEILMEVKNFEYTDENTYKINLLGFGTSNINTRLTVHCCIFENNMTSTILLRTYSPSNTI